MSKLKRLVLICLFISGFSAHDFGQTHSRSQKYEDYINKYKILAIRQQMEYKIPASITLAQGLLESGAGTSRLATVGNNHFGIKCKEEWTGGSMKHTDDAPNECFRTYDSAEASYLDHSLFLTKRKYYVSLFDLDIYDYKAWAYGLQRCGYATDKSYGAKLINLIETYELYQYDRMRIVSSKTKTAKKKPAAVTDDIYEIKVEAPVYRKGRFLSNWRRRIHQVNDIHYITALGDDTYEMISQDTKLSIKRIMKYNEVNVDVQLNEGDIVFLQAKKKYAPKGVLVHTVQEGESLHSISQKYGMRLKTIYKLNKLPNDYVPTAGDVLKLRKK